ncbi:MAG TPA: cupin domain-containing protein, partial [Gemmatimonadales bacterium]|nr:cupin domain-containing protein [Gemmatimonadales bacterium]
MRATLTVLGLAAIAATLPLGRAAAQADDGRVTFLGHDQVRAAFAKGTPLVEVGDYKIHASRRESVPGLAEIHTRDTDIIYVLDGSATLVTGGRAIDAKSTGAEELRGSAIEGGETREIAPGDVVIVPNGTPHWFKQVQGPLLYYVVKVR